MGKCLRCGMEGPFVRVDEQGLCVICRKRAQGSAPVSAPTSASPSIRPCDLNPEDVISRYVSTYHNTYPAEYNVVDYYVAEFHCMLDSLPVVPIPRIACDAPGEEWEGVILKKFDGCSLVDCSDFVALDTETTGLGGSSEIVEVSAVRFEHFRPVAVFETLCKPYRRIPLDATAVHGITNDDVKLSPRFAEIIPALDEFTDRLPLVAHNAPFDMRMLAQEGFPTAGRQAFDTLSLARSILRDKDGNKLASYALSEACKQCAILFSGAHRSSADALAAGLLFLELAKRRFGTENLLDGLGLWKK
ncbi:MAG: 3'-5' exonuclease [Clostridia bacterium]|nr:3'-5' exonuclease [Clostridia bacterium]